jgi:hypothetical protein
MLNWTQLPVCLHEQSWVSNAVLLSSP